MSSYHFTPQAVDDLFKSGVTSQAMILMRQIALRRRSTRLVLSWRIRRSPAEFVKPNFPAFALLARATLPELLGCVQSRDKTTAGYSCHSRGAKYPANIEVGHGKNHLESAGQTLRPLMNQDPKGCGTQERLGALRLLHPPQEESKPRHAKPAY